MSKAAAMAVPVEEYLRTTYEPDADYVDGVVEERNVGESDHSQVQGAVQAILWNISAKLRFRVFPEQRVKVAPQRYRVPDVCVVLGRQQAPPVLEDPPFLCVEVLSREDRVARVTRRLDEYLAFGVKHIWVIDPAERAGYTYTASGLKEVRDGVLRTDDPVLEVRLAEVWAAIDAE